MRFSEDTPAKQQQARDAVAAWCQQNPDGAADQMVAAVGPEFHHDYGPFLRAALIRVDERRDGQSAGVASGMEESR
ncbi:MAG: hypothetical protein ACRDPY_21640 [Streptosporangiaceae bacterium]